MYPSRVQSIIVVGATHIRQPGAERFITIPASLT
jgi:hypothetical protein